MTIVKASFLGGLWLFAVSSVVAQPSVSLGLSASSSIAGADGWPAWVYQSAEDPRFLYGVGIAKSRQDARQQAQAELMLRISHHSLVEQVSELRQAEGVATTSFMQQSTASSLPLELEGAQVVQHSQIDGLHAVMVRVSKTDVITSLQDALTVISRQPPPQQPIERLIWALQQHAQSIQGLQIERALQSLDAGSAKIRQDLNELVEHAQTILSTSSVRIVAQSGTTPFIEALTRQVPASGEELLWLQLDHQQHTGRQESKFAEQRSLQLTLRQSTSPFRIIRQHSLHAEALADSPQAASKDTEYQLIQQLERPLYSWFLN